MRVILSNVGKGILHTKLIFFFVFVVYKNQEIIIVTLLVVFRTCMCNLNAALYTIDLVHSAQIISFYS
jgi:hypothetical protein